MNKKILTIGALALSLFSAGCSKEEPPKLVPARRRTVGRNNPAITAQIETKKVLTQIIDVQEITVPYFKISYVPISKEKSASVTSECTASFRYLHVKGGDVGEEVLILPKDASFIRKYVPVEITVQTVPDKKINLHNLISRFYGKNSRLNSPNTVIEAYGIIEQDGIKYLEGEQK